VELPPPMKPIQEPIVVTSTPPGVPDIEENPCKRVRQVDFTSLHHRVVINNLHTSL
jgi:hypothetical protein